MNMFKRLFGGTKRHSMTSPLSGLEAVQRVLVPQSCADSTQHDLRDCGRSGNEGLVVWSGTQEGDVFYVRTVTVPEQRAIRTGGGVCVVVEGPGLHRLNVWLHKNGERLIAQVHSHPTDAYHSEMDDHYAVVTASGSLSLVVPDFASRPFSVSDCAVYRLTAQGGWREISTKLAASLISITAEE